MGSNMQKDNDIFFHRKLEKFTISFINFIHRFKPSKEIAFLKKKGMTIIFNIIQNSLNIKNVVNIFTLASY